MSYGYQTGSGPSGPPQRRKKEWGLLKKAFAIAAIGYLAFQGINSRNEFVQTARPDPTTGVFRFTSFVIDYLRIFGTNTARDAAWLVSLPLRGGPPAEIPLCVPTSLMDHGWGEAGPDSRGRWPASDSPLYKIGQYRRAAEDEAMNTAAHRDSYDSVYRNEPFDRHIRIRVTNRFNEYIPGVFKETPLTRVEPLDRLAVPGCPAGHTEYKVEIGPPPKVLEP